MKAGGSPAKLERRALDELPAQRAPDDRSQILTGDRVGRKSIEAEPNDASGIVPRADAQIAQVAALESARPQRALEVAGSQIRRPERLPSAGIVRLRRQVRRIGRARPDLRRPFSVAATRRAEVNRGRRTAIEQNAARRGLGGVQCRLGGLAQHLAMSGVAQIELVAAVASQIGHRERADRDRERFERGGRAVARGLAGDDAGDVLLEAHLTDGVAAVVGDADPEGGDRLSGSHSSRRSGRASRTLHNPGINTGGRCGRHDESGDRQGEDAGAVHSSIPRNGAISLHIRGRLAIS